MRTEESHTHTESDSSLHRVDFVTSRDDVEHTRHQHDQLLSALLDIIFIFILCTLTGQTNKQERHLVTRITYSYPFFSLRFL